jgi:hypothetical protein
VKNIIKPEKDQVEELIKVAMNGLTTTIREWESNFSASLVEFLQKNPLRYRGFGPYWWLVKRALIDRGHLEFGDFIDAEVYEAFDYGKPSINLAAAFSYSEERFSLGSMYESRHAIEHEDGDTTEYVLVDEDMELLARQ